MKKLILIFVLIVALVGLSIGFNDALARMNLRCTTCMTEIEEEDVKVYFLEIELTFRGKHEFREKVKGFLERKDIKIIRVHTIYNDHGWLRSVEIWYVEKKEGGIP